jgi:hippurate hydrolase
MTGRSLIFCALLAGVLAAPGGAWAEAEAPAAARSVRSELVDGWLRRNLGGLVAIYRELHANPELSLHEQETALLVADVLEREGYEVEREIGGHGVAGVLRNGKGPTLLIRGDTDALPIREDTGLDYASRVEMTLADGRTVGVMHACGHDVHTTGLLGTARLMALGRKHWSGTLVVVAQPAEELGRGALAMIEGGLFDKVPRPDFTLALHVEPSIPAGSVGYTPGWAMANVDAVDVIFRGRGGHGARPHQAVDPVVAAAHFVTAVQTIVSRRIDPQEAAVITVGSFRAGNKHNVIPDEAHLQLTVRSYSDAVRAQLLEGIEEVALGTCLSVGCAAPAEVSIRENYTPAVYNDPELTERARALFAAELGEERVVQRPPSMGGEDFGRFARHLQVPGLLYRLGASDPKRYAKSLEPGGPALPTLHSSRFAPRPRPTLETGVRTMSLLAMELLQPQP